MREEHGTSAVWQAYRDALAGRIKPAPPSDRTEREPFDKESIARLCSRYDAFAVENGYAVANPVQAVP